MESLQSRLDSFLKTKRIKKHSSKSSSTSASVKWPHPPTFKATASTLSEAGFYFDPSWDDRDSVACFLCGKELSDWDADDDPFDIHYTKCRNTCPWAVVRCGLRDDVDEDGSYIFPNKTRLPSSKVMEKARLGTFKGGDWWPHDAIPGHGACSKKMAQAGFVYTPQISGDDTATCLYCNLSLGGWDKDDDPLQEHRKRESKSGALCPFFAGASAPPSKPSAPSSRSTLGKSANTRGGRTRAASRTRSKPKESVVEEAQSQHSEDELAVVEISDSPPPVRSKRTSKRPTTSSVEPPPTTKAKTGPKKTNRVASTRVTRPPVTEDVVESEEKGKAVDLHETSPPRVIPAKRPALQPPPEPDSEDTEDFKSAHEEPHSQESSLKGKSKLIVDSPPSQPPELPDDVPMRPSALVAEEPLPEAPHVSDDDTRTKTPPPHKDMPPESPMRYTPPGTPSRGFYTPVKPNRPSQDSQSQFGKHVTYASQPDVFQDSKPRINPTSDITPGVPVPVVLTEEERLMTVEQWIQHEITLGTERLRADGLQQIALFKERAEEVRRCIAAL